MEHVLLYKNILYKFNLLSTLPFTLTKYGRNVTGKNGEFQSEFIIVRKRPIFTRGWFKPTFDREDRVYFYCENDVIFFGFFNTLVISEKDRNIIIHATSRSLTYLHTDRDFNIVHHDFHDKGGIYWSYIQEKGKGGVRDWKTTWNGKTNPVTMHEIVFEDRSYNLDVVRRELRELTEIHPENKLRSRL